MAYLDTSFGTRSGAILPLESWRGLIRAEDVWISSAFTWSLSVSEDLRLQQVRDLEPE
jgi:hypothetical protein